MSIMYTKTIVPRYPNCGEIDPHRYCVTCVAAVARKDTTTFNTNAVEAIAAANEAELSTRYLLGLRRQRMVLPSVMRWTN